jgi:hypothetical protein
MEDKTLSTRINSKVSLLFLGGIANIIDNLFYHFFMDHACGLYLTVASAVVNGNSYQSGGQVQQFKVVGCEVPVFLV